MTLEDRDAQMMRQIADGLALVVGAIRARYPMDAAPVEEQQDDPLAVPFLRRTVGNRSIGATPLVTEDVVIKALERAGERGRL